MGNNRFIARYNSDCEHCGDSINPGNEAGYINDDISCENCCNQADAEEDEDA
jgi:hypothetical protein